MPRGSSLVEIILSLTLIGFILVLLSSFLPILFWSSENKHKALAVKAANRKIEELRSLPFDQVTSAPSFSDSLLLSLPQGTGGITAADAPGATGKVKQVDVDINWQERNLAKSIRLTTFIGSVGIGK